MKKILAKATAALMLCGVAAGAATPAAAAPFSVHISTMPTASHQHHKHWKQHLVCTTKWRHHHKIQVCVWTPNGHSSHWDY